MTPADALQRYCLMLTDTPAEAAVAVMGFTLAVGVSQHQPAFMAEMARHLIEPGTELPADVAAEFRRFIEQELHQAVRR